MFQYSTCSSSLPMSSSFFFFNDTATTEIYTLSLHDALPILTRREHSMPLAESDRFRRGRDLGCGRSEEHTSELQSRLHLVCRLLLEKKKKCNRWRPCTVRVRDSAPESRCRRHGATSIYACRT